jgi:hypothetical protein
MGSIKSLLGSREFLQLSPIGSGNFWLYTPAKNTDFGILLSLIFLFTVKSIHRINRQSISLTPITLHEFAENCYVIFTTF